MTTVDMCDWERRKFKIKMKHPEQEVMVDGVALRIKQDLDPPLGLHIGITGKIDVTHIPSGRRIADFATLGTAVEFVCLISTFHDWHETKLDLTDANCATLRDLAHSLLKVEQRPFQVLK